MNKYLKGCLIILGIAILLISGVIAWYYYQKTINIQKAKTDGIKFSEICNRCNLVTEKPSVMLVGFDTIEIRKLHFYIIRQGRSVRDTIVSPQLEAPDQFVITQIPFEKFFKTDTILVRTGGKVKHFYQLSDFHYYAYLHYGMMGYLGSYDCRLDDRNFLINSRRSDGQLLKKFGLTEPLLKKQLKR